MTKALLEKQMLEVFAWIYKDKKTGKNRSKNGIIGYIVLYPFASSFNPCVSVFNNDAIWSRNAPVPPAHVPFIRCSIDFPK